MKSDKPVFAELFGLALFDLTQLDFFQRTHALGDDLLEEFTTSEIGDVASSEGVVIPISSIPGEYYSISICKDRLDTPILKQEQIKITSTGWLLNSTSGELTVCGIGYLKAFDKTEFGLNQKFVRLPFPIGWNSVTITGGETEAGELIYELHVTTHQVKPPFTGDFSDYFNIIED